MPADDDHRVEIHLDRVLAERGLTLTELAGAVGITLANLSILKNGRARAIRFSTLTALCDALDCQPGDLLQVRTTSGPQPPGTDTASRPPNTGHGQPSTSRRVTEDLRRPSGGY